MNEIVNIKKFCRGCGREMIGKYRTYLYDGNTREEIKEIRWKCSNYKWYNFFCDKYRTDESGKFFIGDSIVS